jgi:hypothetical protein
MAGQNYTWQVSSPNIGTGVGVISSTYNINDKNPLTTITENNPSGYVKVFPNSTSTNFNIKNLEYAIQTDGKITYRVQDGTQSPRQFNSLQELADGRGSWDGTTTEQVKTQMNGILSTTAQSKGITPTSPTPAVGDQQGGDLPTGKTEAVPSIETVTAYKQLKIAPDSGLTYPLDRKSTQDRIKFRAYKILPRAGQSQASSEINLNFKFGQRNYESVDGPVFLAIQAGISDQNGVDWGPDSVNAIEAALYNASINLMQSKGGQQLGNKVGELAGQIQGKLRELGGPSGRYLAGQAAGINNVLARTDNIVLNPNLELLFQGPQLRPFSFTFKMSARSQPEANEIKKIIKYFKYHMAVRQTTDKLFLKAPNVFHIEYQYGTSTPHPGLNLIKECALTNCSVDYTPLGSYATYEDGTMVAYTLSLQFQELEPVYDSNYTDDQPIGF